MLKRILIALAFAGLLSPAYSAGTVPGFGPSQQLDNLGKPLGNCFLYTIQAGTVSTPQNAFQDSALTLPLPNPQRCNAAGRLPQFFVADGSIKIRLTDKNGVNIVTTDGILVVGASSGGGGGSPVDPTTIIATGDLKVRYGTGVISGFVRANGRTIGSSTSGATERANADAQTLFQYLWDTDANLVVSTGRGASSAADWAANKTITLPDGRGRALAGLNAMGNSASTVLSSTFCGNADTLGSLCGAESRTLITANLPPYTPAGNNNIQGNVPIVGAGPYFNSFGAGSQTIMIAGGTTSFNITLQSFTGVAQGGTSTAFGTMSPTMLATIYLKL